MPKGVYPHINRPPVSEETRRRMSESHKGKPGGRLGQHWKLSDETKKKMSEYHKKLVGSLNNRFGTKHSPETIEKMRKSAKGFTQRARINAGIVNSQRRGELSPFWNKDVGYRGIHIWIEKERGKPHYCEHCKRSDLKHRQYHWANVSKQYKRELSDWIRLCVKCHKKYDQL